MTTGQKIEAQLDELDSVKDDFIDALEAKGVTGILPTDKYEKLVNDISKIRGVVYEKDVNFYNYDGELLYSYTKEEALALTSLPEGVSGSLYTFDEWNSTLSEIKRDIQSPINDKLYIGALVKAKGANTIICITLTKAQLNFSLTILRSYASGSIDWGDGTVDSYSTSSSTTIKYHSYTKEGDYIIKVSGNGASDIASSMFSAKNSVTEIFLDGSNNARLRENALSGLYNLRAIGGFKTIWSTANSNVFDNSNLSTIIIPRTEDLYGCILHNSTSMAKLNLLSLPGNIIQVRKNAFNWMYNIKIHFPLSIEQYFGDNFYSNSMITKGRLPFDRSASYTNIFYNCSNLYYLEVVRTQSGGYKYNIGQNTIYNCLSLRTLYMVDATSAGYPNAIPGLQSGTLYNLPSTCQIVVRDASYNAFINDSSWSAYSSQIIKKSDWDAQQNNS